MAIENDIVTWFDAQGKDAATVAHLNKVEFEQDNTKIWLMSDWAVNLSSHKFMFAFHVDQANKLSCRYFWESASEGCWRAGTGFDAGTHRFKKGRESDFAGYIFETQLHYLLEKSLNEQYAEKEKIKNLDVLLGKIADGTKSDEIRTFLEQDIFNTYKALVNYETALPVALKQRLDGIDLKFAQGKIKSTTLQQDRGNAADIRQKLKNDNPFWDGIKPCLENKINEYQFTSELLNNSIVKVEVYRYQGDRDVCIEIAYTENAFQMDYKSKDGRTNLQVNTPICWVKSVYINNGGLTSFGNYALFPKELCFLPQKAMDYYIEGAKQIGLTVQQRQGLTFGRNDKYTCLALFDEKYSPLIRKR